MPMDVERGTCGRPALTDTTEVADKEPDATSKSQCFWSNPRFLRAGKFGIGVVVLCFVVFAWEMKQYRSHDRSSILSHHTKLRLVDTTIDFAMLAYFFGCMAIVCDKYMVPATEMICDSIGINDDIAGVTLLGFSSSAPEIVISIVGVIHHDFRASMSCVMGSGLIGFGLIPAVCILGVKASLSPLKVDEFPLHRDMAGYAIILATTLFFCASGSVSMLESGILIMLWFVYLFIVVSCVGNNANREGAPSNHGGGGRDDRRENIVLMRDTSRPKRSSSIYDNGVENNIATTEASPTPTTSLAATENLKYGALDSYYQVEANHGKAEKKEANNASNRSAKGFSKISALPSSRSKANCKGILPEKYRNDEDEEEEEEEEEDGGSDMLFAPFDCLLSYIMPNNMDKEDMLKDEPQEGGGRGAKGEGARERSLSSSSSSSSSSRYCMGLWTTAYVFLMSLVIVAILSEFVMVITSRLSVTLGISKEVSGILFLAMGAQVPDTIESYSMAKAGKANGALSNAFSSQILNMIGGIAVPYFTYTCITGKELTVKLSHTSIMGMALAATIVGMLCCVVCSRTEGRSDDRAHRPVLLGRKAGGIILAVYLLSTSACVSYIEYKDS